MCQFSVCDWHFTVQDVTPRGEILSQPHHPVDIMTVERAAQGFRRRGTMPLLFPPVVQVGDSFTFVQTIDINLVHGWTGRFDSDDMRSFVQIARELESVVKELPDEVFLRRAIILCSYFFDGNWMDCSGLGMTPSPTNMNVLSRVYS